MEADVQKHFDLIRQDQNRLREEQAKDHLEVLRRLERVEENQNRFMQEVAVKSEISKLELRITANEDKMTTAEIDISRFKGQIAAFKIIGALIGGTAIVAQTVIMWWFSQS